MADLKQLVSDTLYGRRMERKGCLTENIAGLELAACEEGVLIEIEKTVESVVIPYYESFEHSQEDEKILASLPPRLAGRVSIGDDLVGLDFLLGAYLAVGVRSGNHRVYDFLDRCSPRVLTEAINSIRIHFRAPEDRFAEYQVAPDSGLRKFIEKHTHSNNTELRSTACYILQMIDKDLEAIGSNSQD